MEENKQQFPTEEVTLPSKGLLYPKDSLLNKGVIEMKYMTAREEDILTNQNYIENGTVIDKLLQSLIITPCNYNELLIGDKNAILVAARILGYGSDYTFKHKNEEVEINLTEIEDKTLDESLVTGGVNNFSFTLPASKIEITFKFLTHGDEISIANEVKGLKKINKKVSPELSTRMKHIITSINGDYDSKIIRKFIDGSFLAKDARALRNYIVKIQPDCDLHFDYEERNGDFVRIPIPIGIQFFWPDVEL